MTKRKPNPFAHLFGGAMLAATVLFNGTAVAQEKPAEVPATAPAQQFKDERALNLLRHERYAGQAQPELQCAA